MRLYPDEQVAGFIADGWWSGRTWLDLLAVHVRERPQALSLVDPANRESITDGPPRWLTWTQVDDEVDRLSRSLYRAGVRKDDVVGVQLPNGVELALIYLAVAGLGAITCPFPVQYAQHELAQMGTMAGLTAFVTTARVNRVRPAEQALRLLGRIPTLRTVLAWGRDLPGAVVRLDDDLAKTGRDAEYRAYRSGLDLHPNDCVTLCWTSGTEGAPKGVPRTHGDWQAVALGTISTPGLTVQDILLNPFPMVNAGGMAGMYLPWLMLGATLVQHHLFDLEVLLTQIETERVTYTCAPPAVLNNLIAHPELMARHDLGTLRAVGSGSAPLSAWMIQGWERDRGVEVLNLFGSNEGLCLFGCPDTIPDPADRGRLFPRPGDPTHRWRARAGRETLSRLVDLQTGLDISEPGRPGELRVSSPTVFAGYWATGDPVASPFDEQGYYRTGDIFEFDGAGAHLLVYVDRAKDLISRGGYKVSAVEIESLLLAHPKVAEAAVVGMPDQLLGERICVFVAPRVVGDPPVLRELLELLALEQVARFKWPERLEIVGALPRNPVGKVLKRQLREELRLVSAGSDAPPGTAEPALVTGTWT
ncbi:class I adenylate-forming enzyme family protein [Nakamurella sp. PAMC28650]|uniref:class I adenylate-forming enzyme family protein n=1 Tax=Nakamurella sp. PAMC28650 TaxID=2762325 RepID=UPI00164EBCAB|nr:class I adenylate-forming enzyme family protein [Nakamurella sp. PAMC28650]QNK79504.1 acyl--CoA ligase [Nakamurella sp. PAMC28650]